MGNRVLAWLGRGRAARQAADRARADEFARAAGVHLGLAPDIDRCWPGCPHTWDGPRVSDWGRATIASYLEACGLPERHVDNLRALRSAVLRLGPRTPATTVVLVAIGERLTELGA